MSESTPATPAVPEVTPPATPATPVVTPAAPAAVVTLTPEEHAQLTRDASRAAANQRKADLYDRTVGSGRKSGHFAAPAPATPPSKEEMEAQASAEDAKAERALLALAASPEYRDVLDADPTLRNLFLTNPLAVLDMYAKDAVDAEDALTLVKDELGKLRKPATPPANPPATPPATPPAPPTGAINPPADQTTNEAVEAAKKNPNTEHAISGMIGARLKGGK